MRVSCLLLWWMLLVKVARVLIDGLRMLSWKSWKGMDFWSSNRMAQGKSSMRVERTILVICLCMVDRYVSLCDGQNLWWYRIRHLVCSPHFVCVFGCIFGICHHFRGKNGVIFGIWWHFWKIRVYLRDGHSRTLYINVWYIKVVQRINHGRLDN